MEKLTHKKNYVKQMEKIKKWTTKLSVLKNNISQKKFIYTRNEHFLEFTEAVKARNCKVN